MTKEFQISTTLTSEEIKTRIQKLLNKKWGIPFLFRKNLYIGNIEENSFKVSTQFDEPPIVLKGSINNGDIEVKVEWSSMETAYKGLVFGLAFPVVFMIIFFILYDNPNSFWSYFFSAIVLTIYYLIQKIIVFFHYQEPNPKTIIKDLKKVLN